MTFVPSAKETPHDVYLLEHSEGYYVGISNNVHYRLEQHKATKQNVRLAHHFKVPTRREAEGVEATFHQLMKQGEDMMDFFCEEFFLLHSLWFHRGMKGYPKHLTQVPRIKF